MNSKRNSELPLKNNNMHKPRGNFEITNDFDFYVYLKANLPSGYTIQSQPSKNYYTEWHFCYELAKDGVVVRTIEGDFQNLEKGSLVTMAKSILSEATSGEDIQ